jgi:hypothetical protein
VTHRVYILTDADLEKLLAAIDILRVATGYSGGSSLVFSKEETQMLEKTHAFYDYQVRGWVSDIKK